MTQSELKEKIKSLSILGIFQVRNKDLQGSIDTMRQVEPLLRQLGEVTGDEDWKKLAERGGRVLSITEEDE